MENQASSRDSKGKGKDTTPNHLRDTTSRLNEATERVGSRGLLPRMAQSAATLPASLLSGPPGSELNRRGEKGESSRAGEAIVRAGESSAQFRSNIPSGGSMRAGQTQEHIAQEEASFAAFLDSEAAPTLSAPGEMEQAWESAASSATGQLPGSRTLERLPQSVVEQEAKDGADVVALLSNDNGLGSVFESVDAPPSEMDLSELRKALFGEETNHGASPIAWDNVLNFIPEYLRGETAGGIQSGDHLSMHLGTTDADEGWQTWISQWSRVLTSYQDEIWGDLNALVEEARAEIQRVQEARAGEKPPEPKALLRLRAILNHLRGA
ncbi:hypothetical protein VTK26DRAFT_2380 [Humicola hyalothermophila]